MMKKILNALALGTLCVSFHARDFSLPTEFDDALVSVLNKRRVSEEVFFGVLNAVEELHQGSALDFYQEATLTPYAKMVLSIHSCPEKIKMTLTELSNKKTIVHFSKEVVEAEKKDSMIKPQEVIKKIEPKKELKRTQPVVSNISIEATLPSTKGNPGASAPTFKPVQFEGLTSVSDPYEKERLLREKPKKGPRN